MRQILNVLRTHVPLSLRKIVGPAIGYAVYFFRVHVCGKTWEPEVLSTPDTLRKIKSERLSAIRFGDGEISLMEGIDLGFQKYDAALAERLRAIVTSEKDKLLICIPKIFGDIRAFTKLGFWFEIHHLFRHGETWKKLTRRDRVYGDAFFARPYLTFKDKRGTKEVYDLIKALWADEDVIVIEGAKSRLGVGNDLFEGARSLRRILCPPENAYAKREDIIKEALRLPKETLMLLSLGPTAKVVAYELFEHGYRVIDIGHVDMEYEMFLRSAEKQVAVPYKYFNEVGARNPEACTDPKYLSEIIADIS